MATLPTPLNPFPYPHRPVNPDTMPDQVRGNDNQLGKALNEHTQDAGLHLVATTTAGVTSTGASTIYPAITHNAFAWVSGDTGSGKAFVDQVAWNGGAAAVLTVSGSATLGVPDARTYTVATGALQLQMAGGTYTITTIPIVFTT